MSGDTAVSGTAAARAAGAAAPASAAWFDRARAVTPGGVNSPVRAFRSVGGTPRFMVSGKGSRLIDVDGKEYVDFVGSWGPMILGHAHPEVVAAVRAAAARGLSFGTPGPGEVLLAEQIVGRVPAVQQVRLVSSGTEATMSALRLARGFTGRTKIIKFAGCYHGHVDALLAAAGSGVATFALPDSAGVPATTTGDVIVLPYNDIAAVEAACAAHRGEIAAIITEAAAANMGVVPPAPGFNAGLAAVAHREGALLIFDEVMTGFRVGPAGQFGRERRSAAESRHEARTQTADRDGVEPGHDDVELARGGLDPDRDGTAPEWAPDLFTFGKVIGGGLPVGAFGGRADVMALLAPEGPVYQAGTLSGNPVAVAAGLATLNGCDAALYDHLDQTAAAAGALVTEALDAASVPHRLQAAGNLFSVFFAAGPVRDYDDARRQSTAAYAALFHSLLNDGIYLPPSAFEAWFVSGAHGSADLDRLAAALPEAASAAAAALG